MRLRNTLSILVATLALFGAIFWGAEFFPRALEAQGATSTGYFLPGNPTCATLGYTRETKIECKSSRCGATSTYWATHSEFGPAAYDPAWSKLALGASTPFLSWGRTYHEILSTRPNGDPYLALAQAYITFELNTLAGLPASPDSSAAFAAAGQILARRGPGPTLGDEPDERGQAKALTEALASTQASFAGTYRVGASDSITVITADNIYFDWTSTFLISAVIVKGGPGANVYTYDPAAMSDGGLSAPINPKTGEPYKLSAIRFCYNQIATPTPTPSATSTPTPTDTPTNTPTTTPTDTPTNTPTTTPTDTPTNTPTNTPTATPTNTPTNTPTATPTNTPTNTPTDTPTPTPTNTPTNTPTTTPTDTPTPTPINPPALS